MHGRREPQRIETVIIGGGQSGLATGYHLQRRGRSFVILDAEKRVGDGWRKRWDSLRLFTPARLSALPGLRCPGTAWDFPTRDEFADYLERYAGHFDFDVRSGLHVDRIQRLGDRYMVVAGEECFEADHVVLATGAHREPRLPAFAPELAPEILQMHSSNYRRPEELRPGSVLVVGAANSGAEIALELAGQRQVWLAGRQPPVFPTRSGSIRGRVAMTVFVFAARHLVTIRTPLGRRVRPFILTHPAPLIRVKPADLAAAGVRRTGRVASVRDGRPVVEDGTALDVANVIWCTGFRSDFSWIDLPAFPGGAEPVHYRGVVAGEPGLYLVGQLFQYALASTFIAGAARDADYIAAAIESRVRGRLRSAERPGAARSATV